MKKFRKIIFVGLVLTVLVGVPVLVLGKDKDDDSNVYIGSSEVITGNVYKVGNVIEINADVPQDVFAIGQSITINGNVGGSVFAAGTSIRINGEVLGSVRVAGTSVGIDGKVGKNVIAVGTTVDLGRDSEVGWDVLTGGNNVELGGKINGRVDAGGVNVVVSGEILGGGKIDVSDGHLSIREGAVIGKTLEYVSEKEVEVPDTVEGIGNIKQLLPEEKAVKKKAVWPSNWFGMLVKLFGLLVVGLVAIGLEKERVKQTVEIMRRSPGKSILWGLLYLVALPIILILLLFTVIGIPLSLIGLAFYAVSLYLAKVIAGIALGGLILSKSKKKDSLTWGMVLGIVVLVIVCSLPIVGGFLSLLAVIWGLGAGVLRFRRR